MPWATPYNLQILDVKVTFRWLEVTNVTSFCYIGQRCSLPISINLEVSPGIYGGCNLTQSCVHCESISTWIEFMGGLQVRVGYGGKMRWKFLFN